MYENRIINLDDMVCNMFGNMSDEDFDKDLKIFDRFRKQLKCKSFKDMYVLVDESSNIEPSMAESCGIEYRTDCPAGIDFYYFCSEDDAERFAYLCDIDNLCYCDHCGSAIHKDNANTLNNSDEILCDYCYDKFVK